MSSHLVFTDEAKFFEIVQTTSDLLEAEQMVRGAKHAVAKIKNDLLAKGDTRRDQSLSALLGKLQDEIHWISRQVTMNDWRDVVTELWGREGLDAIRIRLAAITASRKLERRK